MPRCTISAGHELTAEAGAEVLRAGGNVYDAALAALAAACVVEPVLASLGGGGFLLAAPTGESPRVYDFFVQTPACSRPMEELDFHPLHADFGTTTQEFYIGRGSVAVPGIVAALFAVHRDLGSMPMNEVLAPAIGHAKQGFTIGSLQAYIFSVVKDLYTATADTRALYGSPDHDDVLLGAGETLCQPDLADLLENLALEGAELFYRGEISARIGQDMEQGGQLTRADLENYQVEKRHPLMVNYRGTRLLTNPPPSSGGLLIAFALGLLEAEEIRSMGFRSPAHLQTLARAMELSDEARLEAGNETSDRLLDAELLKLYQQRIKRQPRARRGTTHISIVDAEGNAASLSLSNGEGCGYVVPGTGILLNNMLGEADLNPGGFHRWPPGQRLTSMMAPSLLSGRDGSLAVTGSGGSNRIRSAILQVLTNLVDFEMGVEAAVTAPRIHYEEGRLSVELDGDESRLGALLADFPDHHLWPEQNIFFGGTHTVALHKGQFQGTGDPRRGGVCIKVG